MYTSRSAVEAYLDCNRYRYNLSFHSGKGLSPVAQSVPLVTGGAIHRGVEHLANRLRIGESLDVDTAVGLAVNQYVEDVGQAGFRGKDIKTDRQQWFTFNEQKALVEGMVRAWNHCEAPRIKERYKVVAVEREIEPIEIAPDVLFQARVDIELQEIASGSYVNYSLKTCKEWNERNDDSYKSDLQGITEIWSVEEDARRRNRIIDVLLKGLNTIRNGPDPNLEKIAGYINGKKLEKSVAAIRFCYLVKGRRMVPPIFKDQPNAVKVTYNPLIRGYKNVQPGGVAYAHSWNYLNPENRSGMGKLGQGWEPFNVWEDMGVKEWFQMIAEGKVQPECGDVIKQHVVTPVEYFRAERDIEEGMREVVSQERRLRLHSMRLVESNSILAKQEIMEEVFGHNRKHCFFHYGEKCEYFNLCWKPEVAADPIGNGLYQIRIPHHEAERERG